MACFVLEEILLSVCLSAVLAGCEAQSKQLLHILWIERAFDFIRVRFLNERLPYGLQPASYFKSQYADCHDDYPSLDASLFQIRVGLGLS